ncbi:MAG TPA: hypothetical protein VFR37_08385 [Longimicrobium sp.]|nr:hypothetical protein [Longimicrobium sp.]
MSIPTERQTAGSVEAGPAAAAQQRKADDHWPICRCTHPMHPHTIEERRGVSLERYRCPQRRWWNQWFHPDVWQPPREES